MTLKSLLTTRLNHLKPWLIDDKQMYHECDSIWLAITAPYVSKEKAKRTIIELYINPQSGKIADVIFEFFR